MSTKISTQSDFLPESYLLPDKSKQFMKITPGDNVVRFLSSPLTGWVFFNEDSKPQRRKYDPSINSLGDFSNEELIEAKCKRNSAGELEGSRHFWMALVWDFESDTPKILEITQITIIKSLVGLFNDADWGDLRGYNINVHRKGTGQFDTEFEVTPKPHKALPKKVTDVVEELTESALINLDAIWEGNYPFEKYLF